MPKKTNNGLIIGLVSLLLLVVVASAAVLWLLPPAQPLTEEEDVSPAASPAAAFDLKLFNRSEYQMLHFPLIGSGALPVAPPAAIGKANPFL